MSIHSCDALVLRRYPFRETSVIVSCLTAEFGKIKGLVKGIRGPRSRYRSAMEAITRNRIVFYDTRASQLHLITQCELLDPLSRIQEDLETAQLAAFFVDLTETVVPLEDPQPRIYRLLRDALERLAIGNADRRQLRVRVVLRLLRLAGFEPQVDSCTGCASRIAADGFWSARQGGLLCRRCLHQDADAERLGETQLALLRQLSDDDGPVLAPPDVMNALSGHLDDFLAWRLDRPLRTQRVKMTGLT